MSKHTPGPWCYEIDGPVTNDMRHAVLSEHTGLWIAATYRSGTRAEDDSSPDADDEAKANAKLIADAPALLEALRHCCTDEGPEQEWIDRARALIAKHDGELFNLSLSDKTPG